MEQPANNNDSQNEKTVTFKCPNCGEIGQDDVIFLCNKCDSKEVLQKDGLYLCPACLEPGKNFECFDCGSKDVEMINKSS